MHTYSDSHTCPEGNSLMPNVPLANADVSLTFLGKRTMMRERDAKKTGEVKLEEKGRQEDCIKQRKGGIKETRGKK